MDTIIIAENDSEIKGVPAIREPGMHEIKVNGERPKYTLGVAYTPPNDPVGEWFGAILEASPGQISEAIIMFAGALADTKPDDLIEFQIIFVFHQTSSDVVARIMEAMRMVQQDQRWQTVNLHFNKHVKVARVWLMSCESGGDYFFVPALLRRYAAQAADMRNLAMRAFVKDATPPPNTPPTKYYPQVITLSTGNIVDGLTVLNPERVEFRKGNWYVLPNGEYWQPPPPPGVSEEDWHFGQPSGGYIMSAQLNNDGHTSSVGVQTIAPGTTFNALGFNVPAP
jgi:hypothetical protein